MTGDNRTGDGARHPLPASDEARHDELPETLVSEKGTGDDSIEQIQPAGAPVAPDGERYDVQEERDLAEPFDDADHR